MRWAMTKGTVSSTTMTSSIETNYHQTEHVYSGRDLTEIEIGEQISYVYLIFTMLFCG